MGTPAKVVLLGDPQVGKTSLATRFLRDAFLLEYEPTVSIEISHNVVEADGQTTQLQIWDIGMGQPKDLIQEQLPGYLHGCKGAFLVYDMSHEPSVQGVLHWYNQLHSLSTPPAIVVVGCKSDLQSKVPASVQEFAKTTGAVTTEVSARLGGVNAAFELLARELRTTSRRTETKPVPTKNGTTPVSTAPASQSGGHVKIVLLGDSASGKSSLCLRVDRDLFLESYTPTEGVEYTSIEDSGRTVLICDLGGSDLASRELCDVVLRDANVVMLVADARRPLADQGLEEWLRAAKGCSPQNVVAVLVVTKIEDMPSGVDRAACSQYASSKLGIGQPEAFRCLAGSGSNFLLA
jgi:small GTP-binding protein